MNALPVVKLPVARIDSLWFLVLVQGLGCRVWGLGNLAREGLARSVLVFAEDANHPADRLRRLGVVPLIWGMPFGV